MHSTIDLLNFYDHYCDVINFEVNNRENLLKEILKCLNIHLIVANFTNLRR